MLKKDKNVTASQLPTKKTENEENNKNSKKIEIISKRKDPFIFLDVEIEDMDLDPYTYRLYARYVFRARNNDKGHFECQKKLESILQMSERKIRDCTKILQSLNMIEIVKKIRSDKGHFSSNVIYLTDKSEWKPNKINNNLDQRHHMPTASGTTCRRPAAPHADKLDHNLTRSQFNYFDAVEKIETVQKNETAPKKKNKKKISFKTSPINWIETSTEQKLDILLEKAIDAHVMGVKKKFFKPYNFDYFPMILKPFYDKYSLDLIYNFYNYAIINNAAIDVRNSEKNFLEWQNFEVPPATEENFEVPPATEENFEVPPATEEKLFNELSDDVKTYLKSLPKLQLKHAKIELQKIGVQKYEEYILGVLTSKSRKNKYNKANNIQDNFNKYSAIGG
ncbi:MAG: hypothetical protein K2X69_09700 [Silvanigrellaceae bacterium]|nr:hypothetical protein [Silvanigrellaceae bacterium]